jgi:outer membrane receptor protein involved in Fe transport
VSVLPRTNRVSGFVYSDFALNDSTKLFLQGLYGYTHLESNGNSAILQGTLGATIYSGNPFLPANVQQVMTDTKLASFGFSRYGTAADIQNGRIVQENRTLSVTMGFESKLPGDGFFGDWRINGYYQYGRNKNDQIIKDFIRIDRIYLALDAVRDASGNIVCNAARVNPALYGDCVPLNLFGAGRASKEAIDYIEGPDRDTDSTVTEQDVELAASGQLFDGWAGAIESAIGFDYRHLKLEQVLKPVGILQQSVPFNNPALGIRGIPASSQGLQQVYQFSTAYDAFGSYDVKEGFAEVRVPLLADLAAAKKLDLDLSARLADYSGSGNVWAYKGGLNWQVIDDLRFRGTWSRDVRAATLQERFNNQGAGGAIRDPLLNNLSYTPTIFTGGNPNVKPEESDTLTVGTVYQPGYLPGFSASLDWYDIDVKGAIGQLSAQDIVNQCGVAQNGPTCAFITRDPTTNQIRFITAQYININSLKVSGLDLELGYTHPVRLLGGNDESMSVRVFGTYLKERSQTLSGGLPDDASGDIGAGYPKYRAQGTVTYTKGPFKAFLREQYFDGGLISRNYVLGSVTNTNNTTIDLNHVPSVCYTDLHFTFAPQTRAKNVEIYLNIDNVFDKAPPRVPGFSAMGGSTPTNTGLYDQIGRRYLLGVHVQI